jgi:hypothetical protein
MLGEFAILTASEVVICQLKLSGQGLEVRDSQNVYSLSIHEFANGERVCKKFLHPQLCHNLGKSASDA